MPLPNRTNVILVGAAALSAAAVVPWLLSPVGVGVLITTALFVVLAPGLQIVIGLCGLVNLGYAGFVCLVCTPRRS